MKLGINATRIGGHACRYLAADMREGRIASTFRHGLNVVFKEEVAPTYISIQTPEVPLHPWAIEVRVIPPGIDVGTAALATGRTLRIGTLVPYRLPAAPCELRLESYTPEEAKRALTRLSVVRSQLDECSRRANDPFQQHIGETLRAWQASDDPTTLIELVGLGSGSTPAGDDVLVGVLAGLTALSEVSDSAKRVLEALRQGLAEVSLRRTHPVARQMLAVAGDGSFPEPLLDLVRALGGAGYPEAVRAAAARVLGLGATSGCSFLAGLAAALDADP